MISVQAIQQQIKDGPGHWRSCSGCYETNEGCPTAPNDPVFECALGMGCHECGGLGAVWDSTDYEDFAEFCFEEDRKEAEIKRLRAAMTDIRARTYSTDRLCALRGDAVAAICDIATTALTGHDEKCGGAA